MDQFVSVLVCVCVDSGTSCSKTWPRWTSLSVCWHVCVDRAGQAAAGPGQDGPVCQCVGVCVLTERDKLQQDLAKMDQFEEKLREEQVILSQKVAEMEKELAVYSDLEKLRADAEEKKRVTHMVLFLSGARSKC